MAAILSMSDSARVTTGGSGVVMVMDSVDEMISEFISKAGIHCCSDSDSEKDSEEELSFTLFFLFSSSGESFDRLRFLFKSTVLCGVNCDISCCMHCHNDNCQYTMLYNAQTSVV